VANTHVGDRGRSPARVALLLGLVAVLLLGVSACSSAGHATGGDGKKVAIVAYSVPKPAYDALTKGFQQTTSGAGVSFTASYGASGDQSRAVANGQHADYVAFSIQPDLTKLVPSFVADGWDDGPTKGLVSDSVVVLAVRKAIRST